MSVFDQRGQRVTYQYNAAGDINFGAVQNRADLVVELKKLQAELATAVEQEVLEGEAAIDAESSLKKATLEAAKADPDKPKLLQYLTKAKNLVSGVTGLVGALTLAIDKVKLFF